MMSPFSTISYLSANIIYTKYVPPSEEGHYDICKFSEFCVKHKVLVVVVMRSFGLARLVSKNI